MTQKQLEDYLWGAANILRGMIDAADFKQYIFPLLFFKRVSDLWDEEYELAKEESGGDLEYAEFAENHRFQIPKNCHWEDVRKRTVDVGSHRIGIQQCISNLHQNTFTASCIGSTYIVISRSRDCRRDGGSGDSTGDRVRP